MTAEKIAELKRWLVIAQQPYNPRYKAAKRDAQARVTRFVPELIAAAEAREATQPSAAEVIRVAKAALEFAQQASGSRLFHDSRRKALATISAWEAGNA